MEIWSAERARAWYEATPWLLGMNFLPSTAVNAMEMWQQETFDEATIARELSWAQSFGYNSARVFLPYLAWSIDEDGFLSRFETFLRLADARGIAVLPILFDDCAFDGGRDPAAGPQPDPIPGVHNSRWTPSPGFAAADDPAQQSRLREYVHAVIGTHRGDARIAAWDLYNEPGNTKRDADSLPLLVNAFRWARECAPAQPLTSGFWRIGRRDALYHAALELSDVVSFHSYLDRAATEAVVREIAALGRPIFVTEWLCRQNGSTFEALLPFFAEEKISAWHWGFVVGRTQTNLWWGRRDPAPPVWQHDVVRPDGTPYRKEEMELVRACRRKAEAAHPSASSKTEDTK